MATDNHSFKKTELHHNLQTDEEGNKFFIDKKGRKMIYAGTARTREEVIEAMLDRAVEAEMKRRYPDTYQEPKKGTA